MCMSRMASVCSHVAVLLFKLQAASELDLNKVACTSQLCSWKKSRKRAFLGPQQNFFSMPPKNVLFPEVDAFFEGKLYGYSSLADPIRICSKKQYDMLSELKKITPNATVLTCVSLDLRSDNNSDSKVKDDEETDTAIENEINTIPELFITSFFYPSAINFDENQLTQVSRKLYFNFVESTTTDQCINLERITRLQSMML